MKGKVDITADVDASQEKNVYTIAYNKTIQEIRRESTRRKSNSIGNDSVDFETAISKAGYGKFNYFLLLMTIPAASSSSWVTGSMSLVLPVAGCEMDLTSLHKAWLNSAPYAGMVASAFLWGFLSDTFGRQRLLTFGFILDSLMAICSSFSPTLWPMVFFKFMSGFMVCGPYSIFMAYVSEVFMDKHRNFAVSSAGIFSAIGNIMQPAFAMALVPTQINWSIVDGYDYRAWRIFLFVCAIPSLICGISSAFCVESPKFLLEKGRKEEALKVFKTIYSMNTGKPTTTYPVHKLHDVRSPSMIARSEKDSQKSFFEVLKSGIGQAFKLLQPPYLLRALFVFLIQMGSMTSLNVLRLWLPQMFTAIDIAQASESNSTSLIDGGMCDLLAESAKNEQPSCDNMIKADIYLNMILINTCSLFTQLFYVVLLKFLSKKFIIAGTAAIAAACIINIPWVSPGVWLIVLTSIVMSVLNITFFSVIGCVVEIFPTSLRATSVSLTMMCGRIGILLANIGVAKIMYTNCDLIFYLSFSVLILIAISSLFLSTSPIQRKTDPVSTA